jgi:hypothetical protein
MGREHPPSRGEGQRSAPAQQEQVLPAAQVLLPPVLHTSWHEASAPQVMLHCVLPEQLTVHPPDGQATLHVLLPPHATLLFAATVRSHVLLPVHVTLPPLPVDSVQVLPPAQVDVHEEPQLPAHWDFPAQLVVQPVPQLTLQSFFDWQSNVAPFGGGVVPAPPSPPAPPPSVQLPPLAHVQVEPLHEHEPLQSGELLDDAPEHAARMQASTAGRDSLWSTVGDIPEGESTNVPGRDRLIQSSCAT